MIDWFEGSFFNLGWKWQIGIAHVRKGLEDPCYYDICSTTRVSVLASGFGYFGHPRIIYIEYFHDKVYSLFNLQFSIIFQANNLSVSGITLDSRVFLIYTFLFILIIIIFIACPSPLIVWE